MPLRRREVRHWVVVQDPRRGRWRALQAPRRQGRALYAHTTRCRRREVARLRFTLVNPDLATAASSAALVAAASSASSSPNPNPNLSPNPNSRHLEGWLRHFWSLGLDSSIADSACAGSGDAGL